MQLPAGFGGPPSPGSVEQPPDRHAVDAQLVPVAEVGEHQHADGVPRSGHAARAADPALPVEADHPGAGADGPLGDRLGGGRVRERAAGVVRLDLHDARVVQPAVVALAHDRDHDVVDADARVGRERGRDRAVEHAADRHRGREVDGRVELAPLGDLERAGQLARAVQHRDARGQRLSVDPVRVRRHHRGHARAREAAAVRRVGLVAHDGHVAHAHAVDVRDRGRRARARARRSAGRAREGSSRRPWRATL